MFAILCLLKPRYAGDKNQNDYEYCNQNYLGFENFMV